MSEGDVEIEVEVHHYSVCRRADDGAGTCSLCGFTVDLGPLLGRGTIICMECFPETLPEGIPIDELIDAIKNPRRLH